jgi:hypothetical protein
MFCRLYRCSQQVLPKLWYLSTRLDGVIPRDNSHRHVNLELHTSNNLALKESNMETYCINSPRKESDMETYCINSPRKESDMETYCINSPRKESNMETYCINSPRKQSKAKWKPTV